MLGNRRFLSAVGGIVLTAMAALAASPAEPRITVRPTWSLPEWGPLVEAVPFLDYPDSHPEMITNLPDEVVIVLRAPENRRLFRFVVGCEEELDPAVKYKWVRADGGRGNAFTVVSRPGYDEVSVTWSGLPQGRLELQVWATYKGELVDLPPARVTFMRVPGENRRFSKEGWIESIDYTDVKAGALTDAKPWIDSYACDEHGRVIGYERMAVGAIFRDSFFYSTGERILERHANDAPAKAVKVVYVRDERGVISWHDEGGEIAYPLQTIEPRTRGEWMPPKSRRR